MKLAIATLETALGHTNDAGDWAAIVEALEGLRYKTGRAQVAYEYPARFMAVAA